MTTFQPTEAELLERGFKKYHKTLSMWNLKFLSSYIAYDLGKWIVSDGEDVVYTYPTSFEDIDAIIRIFTPKK